MLFFLCYFLVLSIFNQAQCEPNLQFVKKVDDSFTPISSITAEEKLGSKFTLLCELVFSKNESGYDEKLFWIKDDDMNKSIFADLLVQDNDQILHKTPLENSISNVNKAEITFNNLKTKDSGKYICVSSKYRKHKVLYLVTRLALEARYPYLGEAQFCSDHMFRCVSNGVCIITTYVCDGKPDCKDGSDESLERCDGEPCRDKLNCSDGRCIPTSWCCDRNHDPNCTVTNRPKCCQLLSESYDELESAVAPNLTIQTSNARYLFMSVSILGIVLSIVLLLLILSKAVTFAKKNQLHTTSPHDELHNFPPSTPSTRGGPPHQQYRYNTRTPRIITSRTPVIPSNCDMSLINPLLLPFGQNSGIQGVPLGVADQPPSYRDVINEGVGHRVNICEPPPPYTSREVLNE